MFNDNNVKTKNATTMLAVQKNYSLFCCTDFWLFTKKNEKRKFSQKEKIIKYNKKKKGKHFIHYDEFSTVSIFCGAMFLGSAFVFFSFLLLLLFLFGKIFCFVGIFLIFFRVVFV